MGFIAFTIFNLIFNLYMSALGFSNDAIGVFNALPALAVLFVGVPVGALADRVGYRAFLVAATVAAVMGAAVLSVAADRLPAVLAAGLYSLGVTILGVLGIPMLAQLAGTQERVSVYAVNQSLSWVASVAGDLLGGYIPEVAARAGFAPARSAAALRLAFLAMTALELIAAPMLLALATRPALKPAASLPLKLLVRVDWARFARILAPQALLGMGAGMLLNFIQLYLAQRFHLSPGPIGLVLAGGALLTAGVTLAAPAVGGRLGISRTVGFAQLAGVPFVLVLAFVQAFPLALVALYLRQSALNLQAPLNQVFGMEFVAPQERARLASAQEVVFHLGFAGVGPLLSGFLQVRGGYQLAFSASALFYLLAGSSYLRLLGQVRLPSEDGSQVRAPSSRI